MGFGRKLDPNGDYVRLVHINIIGLFQKLVNCKPDILALLKFYISAAKWYMTSPGADPGF